MSVSRTVNRSNMAPKTSAGFIVGSVSWSDFQRSSSSGETWSERSTVEGSGSWVLVMMERMRVSNWVMSSGPSVCSGVAVAVVGEVSLTPLTGALTACCIRTNCMGESTEYASVMGGMVARPLASSCSWIVCTTWVPRRLLSNILSRVRTVVRPLTGTASPFLRASEIWSKLVAIGSCFLSGQPTQLYKQVECQSSDDGKSISCGKQGVKSYTSCRQKRQTMQKRWKTLQEKDQYETDSECN